MDIKDLVPAIKKATSEFNYFLRQAAEQGVKVDIDIDETCVAGIPLPCTSFTVEVYRKL